MIHIFIGTKAQYIKTAPLLRLMDSRSVTYRLIDSGQHGELATSMRAELGVREPDVLLGGNRDVTTIPQAIGWAARLGRRLISRSWIRANVFGGEGGVCVVHGDTPSTLLSTLMARRAGLSVAHLEAGLRSHRWFHPFPEEIIRMLVMRRSDLLFAPDVTAVANLEAMSVSGRVIPLDANTSIEAVRHAGAAVGSEGPAVVTMHRVENLHRPSRRSGFVDLVTRVAAHYPTRFLIHEPTRSAMTPEELARIEAAGVELTPLVAHEAFVRLLAAAPLVVTDGGSIQEECALIGVPTLLWREQSERPDGIGENVVVSGYNADVGAAFIENPGHHRRPPRQLDATPSARILDELLALP